MSFAVAIVNSFQGMSPSNEILLIRPRGNGLRTVAPCNMSGKLRSSTYSAAPVTFLRPSFRGMDLPISCDSSLALIWWKLLYNLWLPVVQAKLPSFGKSELLRRKQAFSADYSRISQLVVGVCAPVVAVFIYQDGASKNQEPLP